jgi:transposase
MLLAGKTPAQAAHAVGVARQTAYTWKAVLDDGGIDALRAMPTRGRPARLDDEQLQALGRALLQRPTEHGFGTELWTLKRVGVLIERLYGVKFGQTQIWRILGRLGFSVQKPERRAIERDEDAVQTWKRKTWPARAHLGTQRADADHPVPLQLDAHLRHRRMSRTNCLFRLHEGSIKKEQHVEFLKALRAHLKQPLLIIWDGLKAHRSKLVREYLDSTDGAVQMAFLPPYSPDLNPVEFLWAWLKRHALANFCPANLDELNVTARNKLKSAQRRPSIIAACWAQAELW